MVYFATWDEFFEASTRLFLEHQQHVRGISSYHLDFRCLRAPRRRVTRRGFLCCVILLLLSQTRYTVKYRPAEQKVVLTVTNDVQVL